MGLHLGWDFNRNGKCSNADIITLTHRENALSVYLRTVSSHDNIYENLSEIILSEGINT